MKKPHPWIRHLNEHKAAVVLNGFLAVANVPLTLLSVLCLAFAFRQLNTSADKLLWEELVGPIITPTVQRWFVGTQFESGLSVSQQLETFVPFIVTISILLFCVRFFQEYMQEHVGEKISLSLRQKISQKYSQMEFTQCEKLQVGTLAQMFADDCREIRQTYTRLWGSIPSELLLAGAHGVLLAILDPQLFLLLVAVLAPAAVVIRVSGKKLKFLARQGIHLQSSLFDTLLEKTKGWESIQSLGRIDREMNSFEQTNDSLFHVWRRAARARSAAQPLVEWLGICAGAAVLVLALRRVADGALSTPVLSAFLMLIASLANSLQGIVGQLNSARKGTECLKRVHQFLDNPSTTYRTTINTFREVSKKPQEFSDFNKTHSSDSLGGLCEIQVVNYANQHLSSAPNAQATDTQLQKDQFKNFTANLGDIVALVGPSGAGKSTFLKALLGLIPVNETGQVLWNKKSIFDQNVREHFTHEVAFLPQESYIIAGSILDNLSYPEIVSADNPTTWKRALKSMELAQLKSRGLTESASSLSGGERQRLMFARAFFREAKIWVLDEATSALDAETERLIALELVRTQNHRIVIMAAHRHAMIQLSQKVIYF